MLEWEVIMKILGISCCVPKNKVDSSAFVPRFGEELVERIVTNTGIKERRIARPETCTSDLCVAAAEQLFEQTGVPKDSVDALVFLSQTPDYLIPATSGVIQDRLGLPTSVFAFDVNQGCTGYTDGLMISQGLLNGLGMKRILLLMGDTLSKIVDPNDQGVAMLFGDAGSATLLEASKEPFHFVAGTDGSGADIIHQKISYRNGLHIDCPVPEISTLTIKIHGAKVYEFTIERIPPMVNQILTESGWIVDEVDAFVLHQANQYIMRNLARMMKIPMSKVPISLDEFGNTSSGSIPLTMVTRLQNELRPVVAEPTKLVFVGFGVGLAWSAVCVNWQDGIICPLIEMEC